MKVKGQKLGIRPILFNILDILFLCTPHYGHVHVILHIDCGVFKTPSLYHQRRVCLYIYGVVIDV